MNASDCLRRPVDRKVRRHTPVRLYLDERQLPYWADPRRNRLGEFNTNDGGRGVYWEDPSGHFLEIITRPYGSGT